MKLALLNINYTNHIHIVTNQLLNNRCEPLKFESGKNKGEPSSGVIGCTLHSTYTYLLIYATLQNFTRLCVALQVNYLALHSLKENYPFSGHWKLKKKIILVKCNAAFLLDLVRFKVVFLLKPFDSYLHHSTSKVLAILARITPPRSAEAFWGLHRLCRVTSQIRGFNSPFLSIFGRGRPIVDLQPKQMYLSVLCVRCSQASVSVCVPSYS